MTTIADLVEPKRTALVVVDVQNDFCKSEASQEILPRLKSLVETARAAGVTIIRIRTIHGDKTNTPVWVSRFDERPESRLTCQEGLPGADFVPGFEPAEGDIVVVKHRYSAFIGTDLEMILRARRIESCVFTGVATNVCVESTAREAFQRDFWTVTVSDCTAAGDPESHAASLRVLARQFGRVAASTELLPAWEPVAVPVPVA